MYAWVWKTTSCIPQGVLAESNAQFVERAKRVIEEYGNEVATPDEAREILSLK